MLLRILIKIVSVVFFFVLVMAPVFAVLLITRQALWAIATLIVAFIMLFAMRKKSSKS